MSITLSKLSRSTPVRGSRDTVAEAICGLISRGDIAPGHQMPTEEKLVAQFKVSRPTIRAALDILETNGVIRKTANRARVVADHKPADSMISSTVVIVGQPIDASPTPSGSQGWWNFVQYGATQALQSARLHRLLIDQDVLDAALCVQICRAKPRGIIVLRRATRDAAPLVKVAKDYGIPVIVQGNEPEFSAFDRVSSDHRRGCQMLTTWMADQGCKRILRLWHLEAGTEQSPLWLAERDAGYELACRERGIDPLPTVSPDRSVITGGSGASRQAFEAYTRYWVGWLLEHLQTPNPVDGILAISDGQTYSIAAACRLLGRVPGRDVIIAGYDNYWKDSLERQWESYTPPVTVDKNNVEVGRQLVDILLARGENRLPPEPQHRVIEPSLVVNPSQSG